MTTPITLKFLIFLFLLLSTAKSLSASKDAGLSATVGVSTGYVFPGTVRGGYKDVEIGLMSPSFLGISKLIRNDSIYTSVGVGMTNGIQPGFGFYGGLGWMPEIWSIFSLRFEAAAVAGHTGIVKGELVAALALEF